MSKIKNSIWEAIEGGKSWQELEQADLKPQKLTEKRTAQTSMHESEE